MSEVSNEHDPRPAPVRTRTRVLWVIKGLGLGGAERTLVDALPAFDRARFEIEVAYLLERKHQLVGALEQSGAAVHALGMRSNLGALGAIVALRRLLRERRIDVVHAHLPMAGVVARLAARGMGVPVVYTEHNLQERYHAAMRLANRLTYGSNARVLAVSAAVADSLRRRGLHRQAPVVVVPNGVPVAAVLAEGRRGGEVRARLGIPGGALVVGTVAVFREQKRLVDWVEVARRVCAQHEGVVFLLAGDGPEMPRVRRAVEAAGLGGRLILPGFRPDGRALIGALDLFLMTSAFEGLPIALLEAMALGKPVVATPVGGIPEAVVDGGAGLLRGVGDTGALAEAVLWLLRDDALRLELAARARSAIAAKFTLERGVRAIETIYGQLA
ncbi:MAG TPA: glycosyltransferase [Candidatus Methanoperedens sp.]|nr:glycosyltransferase [Candidatus Methanoperedens sp.]